LLPAPGIKSMLTQQRSKLALAHFSFLPAVHGRPPLLAGCMEALRKERQTVEFAFK
jgi:hypothetical protein